MNFYPLTIQPIHEDGEPKFIVRFDDVPGASATVDTRERGLAMAPDILRHGLGALYLGGRKMPSCSAVKDGQIAVAAPYFWMVL